MSSDKIEITELLYRYAELIDAGDFDGVGQLLARSTFGGPASSGSVSGAESIAKLFAMTTRRYPDHGNTPCTRHLVLNPIVELNGDGTAATRSTFCVVQDTGHTATVPIQPIVVGRYYDRFDHDDGGWYFTERTVEIQMIGDVSAHLMVDPKAYEK